MSFLAGFATDVGSLLFNALAFVTVLSIVVFVHELGHFLVARWCGVTVSAFSIGFGRELFAWTDRRGTRWRFAAIPLGGYVKFLDDQNVASAPTGAPAPEMTEQEKAGAFHLKPLWQRAAVVAAGPIANFVFAIAVFSIMFMLFGLRITSPKVDEVVADMPAAKAGIQVGDVIKEIDGQTIRSFNDVRRIVGRNIDRELRVTIDRNGQIVELKMTPVGTEVDDNLGGKVKQGLIGIRRTGTAQSYVLKHPGPLEAVWLGVKETHFVIASTLGYIGDVFAGRQNANQLGGVVRIAEATRQVVKLSPEALPHFIALISVSVGLINLFPIPILDGGHLMFYAIEAVRRRPLSERTQEFAFRMGLAVILALMLFAFWNDRMILGRWIGAVG